MINRKSYVAVTLVGIIAMVLLAGGMAMASNTGFKLNKSLAPSITGGNTNAGNNWLSIPYFNPYGNAGAFCTQTGLVSTGLGAKATITVVDPATGATQAAVQCGSAPANLLLITPGRGIRVRNTPAGGATPTSIIIVGSHDPSLAITIPKSGAGTVGDFWFAVPYHTTAANAGDLCLSSGFSSTGFTKATISRLDPVTGVQAAAVQCGTANATAFTLTLGEAIKVREPNGPLTFVPAHF